MTKKRMTQRSQGEGAALLVQGVLAETGAQAQFCSYWHLIAAASPPYSRYSVGNAFFDEKEDTCAALGEISVNTR